MRFTQLLIAAGTASLALAARLKSKTKRTSVFQFGSNESGAEFGSGTIPGVPGKDCIWLNTTAIGIMKEAGTRVEHLPCAISHGASSTTSLEALMRCTWLVWSLYTNYITSTGAYALIDPRTLADTENENTNRTSYGEFAYEYYLKVFGAIFSKVELYGNVDGEGDCYGDCFEYELDNRVAQYWGQWGR
ncbi:uncharacterized protein AFUA_8G01950 [Aspergillus fumigatus Af293]|uniref:Uncharacterized protein n=1 Tax=Aspergillus fumigatus (strain ATCC MYA-4609 / CBS 101355 / FGSC A1100 / Af293) TaxID=330879 RepID=Q4WBD9_ASPFU|nr:hypothetical protein AFUA_8G01950 [Aspergillus fumigatus Af293]EAL84973.2 hypothetical protein AFUA_8G01950 [Aspergillus fumigatus Af293]